MSVLASDRDSRETSLEPGRRRRRQEPPQSSDAFLRTEVAWTRTRTWGRVRALAEDGGTATGDPDGSHPEGSGWVIDGALWGRAIDCMLIPAASALGGFILPLAASRR